MPAAETLKQAKHTIGLFSDKDGEDFEVNLEQLRRFSEKWAYVAKKRRRWRSLPMALVQLKQAAHDDLKELLHAPADFLSKIAKCGAVEVDYGESETVLQAAAAAPWEMILNLATDRYRSGSLLFVTRCLSRICKPIPNSPKADRNEVPRDILIITSAPGSLSRELSFETELKLLKESFDGRGFDHLEDPDLAQIRDGIPDSAGTVIHFTGFDQIEGGQIRIARAGGHEHLDSPANDLPSSDFPSEIEAPGFYLAKDDGGEVVVTPEELAGALAVTNHRPLLVAFNCYNSASHLASYAVRFGVHFGIGIQDRLDNPLLEKFFANFYRCWNDLSQKPEKRTGVLTLLKAFWTSVLALQGQSNFGYLVLWSDRCLRGHFKELLESLRHDLPNHQVVSAPKNLPAAVSDEEDTIEVDARPFRELNYSMIHNHRSMFKRFVLKARRKFAPGVQVEVTLHVRGENYHYKTTCDVRDYFHKLDHIQVSLTSELLRNLRESVYTTLYICVTYKNRKVAEITEKVMLLPVNEWRDSATDGVWLPSFVLPYDPAVLKIIDRAQKYLKSLLDDSSASFNGYQWNRPGVNDFSGVHAQVRAIWAAMTYDFPLEYIAPPPTFTDQSQRIRTPSDVFAERRGTCIDLTLLLAACLEHVEMRPVLFLLSGHAFPGYFRSVEAHTEFVKLFSSESLDSRALSWKSESSPQAWVLEADAYYHVLNFVRSGKLVPLEATWLTKRASLSDSHAQGRKNLSSRFRFESVHDVKRARQNGVTPLPIGGLGS
ncbi:MAG: hypothetical protein ABSG69_17000 [Candidatus Acidiferrum sp.]|jgi:hypothetical protein